MADKEDLDAIAELSIIEARQLPPDYLAIRGKISRYLLRPIKISKSFDEVLEGAISNNAMINNVTNKVAVLIYLAVTNVLDIPDSADTSKADIREAIEKVMSIKTYEDSKMIVYGVSDFVIENWPKVPGTVQEEIQRFVSILINEFTEYNALSIDEIFRYLYMDHEYPIYVMINKLYQRILIEEEIRTFLPKDLSNLVNLYI